MISQLPRVVIDTNVYSTPTERQEARQRWDDLRKRLRAHPTDEAVSAALRSREPVEPEPDLSPAARDLILRLEGNPATADAELHQQVTDGV